jgi:hypothetical protein
VAVPDETTPEVEVLPTTPSVEACAELESAAPEDEPLTVCELKLTLPVMVVPGSVVVAPGTYSVVGLVQGQSLITVGPGTMVVEPEMMMVSPPLQVTELG